MEAVSKTKGRGTRARGAAGDPVDRAVAALRSAQDRLVQLVASGDEAVSARARAALQAQDPLPIWPVTEALLKARDATLRLKLVGALAAMGRVEPVRVVVSLGEAVKGEKDRTVRLAILNTMVGVGMGMQQARGAPDRGDGSTASPAASQVDEGTPDHGRGRRGAGTGTA